MHPPLHARLLAAALLLLSFATAHAEPIDFSRIDPADHASDLWYLDTIDDRPVGYWRSWLAVEDDHIVTGYMEHRVEKHGGETVTSHIKTIWTETRGFKPISIVVEQANGSDTVKQTYRFVDEGIELISEQNGRTIKQTLPPIKGDYLTAAQLEIAVRQHVERGDKDFELDTLDPIVGMTPYVTRYRQADEAAKPIKLADDREVNAKPWDVTFGILPGFKMRSWIDHDQQTVGVSYDIGKVKRVSRLSDASVEQVAFDPPEMAQLSVVVPDKPIKNPRQQKKIVYELTYDAGDAAILPITTALQTVEKQDDGRVRLTVDLDTKTASDAQAKDAADKEHLAASIRVDHEDKVVRELAAQAVKDLKDGASAEEIATACKRMVASHLSGASLSVGDGTASEAARSRRGDCTESAVLLAALLRAHKIPSRCVSGLVYSEDGFAGQENVFVYHMWTQAWIEDGDGKGRWIDLDAAMWRYSAGHIALGVSSMGDNAQQELIRIIPMMQNLEIKVIETTK